MPKISELIKPRFIKAGWFEGRNTGLISAHPNQLVAEILNEFGGLDMGETKAGLECAASDIIFFSDINEMIDEADDYKVFEKQTGPLSLIADAHHNHIQVLVAENGQFYVYTIPDGKLYSAGNDFNDVMERMLLGIKLGPLIFPV